jgi:glycosyltransferase involved in cell wall biosynthesis
MRARLRRLAERIRVVHDIHAVSAIDLVRELCPDLGLVYGSPILKPELFDIPRHGTIGIHHGKVPQYRGNKTGFWAMYHGERTVGVTIQKINAGLDTGSIVLEGSVPATGRRLGSVLHDLEALGLELYLQAIDAFRTGDIRLRPQVGPKGRLFRNPTFGDLMRFHLKQARRRCSVRSAAHGVCILTETYYPVVGGGETQARTLACGLIGHGYPVSVVTRRTARSLGRWEVVDDACIRRVGPTGHGQIRKWALIFTTLPALVQLRHAYDVLFVSGFRIIGVPAVLVAKLLGKTVVLKADSQGEMSGEYFAAGLKQVGLRSDSPVFRVFLAARNAILRRADAFVAITDGVAAELDAAGIDPRLVQRIANSVDDRRFRAATESGKLELRAQLGIDPSDKVVIYTGRLVSYKGLPLLLNVWKDLRAAHPNARLLLVGTGGLDIHNCEEDLKTFVLQHELGDSVSFTGSVEKVEDYLQAADIFVLPSEDDAFPSSLVEAMACRLAVLATPVGAIPSVIDHARNGLIVQPRDYSGLYSCLDQLLTDDALRTRLADAGLETVEARYYVDRVTGQMVDLFRELRSERAHAMSDNR